MNLLEEVVVDVNGEAFDMRKYNGQWTLLWFAPAAPPGCAQCGNSLRTKIAQFHNAGGVIVGLTFFDASRNKMLRDGHFGGIIELFNVSHTFASKFGADNEGAHPKPVAVLIDPKGALEYTYNPVRRIEDVVDDAIRRTGPKLWERLRAGKPWSN